MNLERLRAVQAEEREADSLRAISDSFYREVATYVEGLREERARAAEAVEDPFDSDAVRRLTDEIETAEEVAEAIYERRVGKLVKRASLAAAGMPADEEGLTAEEAELFSALVEQIEAHREEVLASFAGESDDGLGSAEPPDEARSAGGADGAAGSGASGGSPETGGGDPRPADASASEGNETPESDPGQGAPATSLEESTTQDVGGSGEPNPGPGEDGDEPGAGDVETADGGDAERVTLRITRDVGEVFGVDERVYDLAAEDVVSLPAANAKPLVERDAAERID